MSVAARLQVQYSTQDAFRAEYASNVSRGGIFIATDDGFEVRDMVEVELALIFCDEVHVLEGEVVHCITADTYRLARSDVCERHYGYFCGSAETV